MVPILNIITTVKLITLTETIHADIATVWNYLTCTKLVAQWMAEGDDNLIIECVWTEGAPIIIKGFLNGKTFTNEGCITVFKPYERLQYKFLNSISREHYQSAEYSTIDFHLNECDSDTHLEITCLAAYTEIEEKHLKLYWNSTIRILKAMIEKS